MIERIWRGDDALSRAARVALLPFEAGYRAVTSARGWMYEHEMLAVERFKIPVISIGNLSVGGTGKTPFTAWIASELSRRGQRPAVILRGYGGDEVLVHRRLNPEMPVIVDPHRANGIARATQLGATVAVLDDAFQHRAAAREIDIALVAAEQWGRSHRLLPAGPWREPLSALRRASLAIITAKTADSSRISAVRDTIARDAPHIPQAVVRFSLSDLRSANNQSSRESLPLSSMAGRPVAAIAGIAEPNLFFEQLTALGAIVVPHPFPDHHRYSSDDIERVLATSGARDALVVCTLKDTVKLASIWPASAPSLWYVLQALDVESGEQALAEMLSRITQKPAHGP
ncbi:MAG: tetraacyldisaccharide 4'-kinase [Gemmatimonadaceae bacterium]